MRELSDALAEGKWIRAQNETWGHLKAKPGQHRGYMIFGCGEYGEIVSITSDFENVPGSPWFFQAHQDFMCAQEMKRGQLYVFTGYYQRGRGDDCGRFTGTVKPVNPASLLNL